MPVTLRKVEPDDLQAAMRGLGMDRMTRCELRSLIDRHVSNPLFASLVIARAAQQVLANKST